MYFQRILEGPETASGKSCADLEYVKGRRSSRFRSRWKPGLLPGFYKPQTRGDSTGQSPGKLRHRAALGQATGLQNLLNTTAEVLTSICPHVRAWVVEHLGSFVSSLVAMPARRKKVAQQIKGHVSSTISRWTELTRLVVGRCAAGRAVCM